MNALKRVGACVHSATRREFSEPRSRLESPVVAFLFPNTPRTRPLLATHSPSLARRLRAMPSERDDDASASASASAGPPSSDAHHEASTADAPSTAPTLQRPATPPPLAPDPPPRGRRGWMRRLVRGDGDDDEDREDREDRDVAPAAEDGAADASAPGARSSSARWSSGTRRSRRRRRKKTRRPLGRGGGNVGRVEASLPRHLPLLLRALLPHLHRTRGGRPARVRGRHAPWVRVRERVHAPRLRRRLRPRQEEGPADGVAPVRSVPRGHGLPRRTREGDARDRTPETKGEGRARRAEPRARGGARRPIRTEPRARGDEPPTEEAAIFPPPPPPRRRRAAAPGTTTFGSTSTTRGAIGRGGAAGTRSRGSRGSSRGPWR